MGGTAQKQKWRKPKKAAPREISLYLQNINQTTSKWKIFKNYFSLQISNLQRIVI